jgi:hypothetical protein
MSNYLHSLPDNQNIGWIGAASGAIRTSQTAGETVSFQAYDTDAMPPAFMTLATLNAGAVPSLVLAPFSIRTGGVSGGTELAAVRSNGDLFSRGVYIAAINEHFFANAVGAAFAKIDQSSLQLFSSQGYVQFRTSDTYLQGLSAGQLYLHNGTSTPAGLSIANIHTSPTSGEWLKAGFASNVARIETVTAGGTARPLALGTAGVIRTQINADGTVASGSCYSPATVYTSYASGQAPVSSGSASAIVDASGRPKVTLTEAGAYEILWGGSLESGQSTITLRLRRINNTPQDLPNCDTVVSNYSGGQTISGRVVIYSAGSGDEIRIYGFGASTGISLSDPWIVAKRIS